ncbi:MAG: hypothetical protein AAF667_16860 [Pseudomonadota bacterium]
MTRFAIIAAPALLAVTAEAGTITEVCSARGTWDAATCDCMQEVADEMFDGEQQETVARFFSGQVTSQQIALEQGVDASQAFLQSVADFMGETTFKCGAP